MTAPPVTASAPEFVVVLRSLGVELVVRRHDRGVVLEGTSHSYYGKQMAQELARKAGYVIVANAIVVDRWRPAAGSPADRSTGTP